MRLKMGILTGHALPVQNLPFVGDHTYVTSDQGHAWGCFGRTAGGQTICSGNGSEKVADCLSKPNGEAGLRYLVTGVCHQAANRILYPAGGILVDKATGYRLSVFAFTTYGLGSWPEKQRCMPPTGTATGSTLAIPPSSGPGGPIMSKLEKRAVEYTRRIRELYAREASAKLFPLDRAVEETAIAADVNLGRDEISLQELLKVIAVQQGLHELQYELSRSFERRRMTADEYYTSLSGLLSRTFEECEDILGPERFKKMFGAEPGVERAFIDKQTLTECSELDEQGYLRPGSTVEDE